MWWLKEILGVEFEPYHLKQEEIVRTFYQNRYNPNALQYKTLIILAGMRSGKTALASMIACYELWDVLTMRNPANYYGLIKGQQVTLCVLSTSQKQSDDGIWGNISNFLAENEWFSTWTDLVYTKETIESIQKRVLFRNLSSWMTTGVGRSNRFVGFDELDLFENKESKRGAWSVYEKMVNSTATFGSDGHVMAISSSNKNPNSIMNTLIREEANTATTLTYLLPTWEMNTHHDLSMAVLKELHKNNPAAFWNDFACQPGMWTSLEFPEGVKTAQIPNVLHTMVSPNPSTQRVCAIDPAVMNDAFGIAVGYMHNGRYIVDGVTKYRRGENSPFISPKDISDYLDKVYKMLGVSVLIHDTWMFPEIIENAQNKYGIRTEKHVVRKEDYDRWREFQQAGLVDVVSNDELVTEAKSLVVVNEKRVDHPFKGSKDMADCVANVLWCLSTMASEDALRPRIIGMVGF